MSKAETITVRPDSKGRIALGALAKGVSSFRAHLEAGGKIVLEPFVEIPAREIWLHRNPKAMEKVKRGIADAEAGRLHDLGDFTQFVED